MKVGLIVAALVLVPAASFAAAKPKAKATPKPAATAKPSAHDDTPAVASPERPFSEGAASFKLGQRDYSLSKVQGSIQTSSGFQIASVRFEGNKGFPKLQLDFMYTGTGTVDPSYITNFFAIDDDKTVTAMKAHVTNCEITLEKATPSMIEGTASCPKGMFNNEKPGKPVTDVKFHAESK